MRDFLVSLTFGSESETVSPDYATGMKDTIIADYTILVNGGMRIEYAVISYRHVITDISVRVYHTVLTHFYAFSDVGEVTDITIVAHDRGSGDKSGRINPLLFALRLLYQI